LGIIIIAVFFRDVRQNNDKAFRLLWLAITLSFAFYIPVVLWADAIPIIGMLMIPKTCAYVWIVWMGYADAGR
jgi:ABC-type iron transport system FetAB permease component